MKIITRLASADDTDAILLLVRQLAESSGEASPLDAEYVIRYMIDGSSKILIAEIDGRAAGMLSFCIRPNLYHAGNACVIDELAISEIMRGLGIGRVLVNAMMEIAEREKCVEIVVAVNADNERAIEFYRRHGLVEQAILLEKHCR